ncbi:MAG: acyltransferase [Lysobacteraceae bacterium]|nr:MAG: acyltransferase [Xanthomonadaceae bacterium]
MSADWKKRPEGGGRLAIWMIRAVACHGGRRLGRACLYPITLYFALVRGPERRASQSYLARVLGRPAGWGAVLRHVHTFAATILDRVFLLGGRLDGFDVRVGGLPELHEVLDQQRGLLLFGSHLGSFEVLRVLARQRPDYKIRVVLDKTHNPALTEMLDALDPAIAAGVIDAGQDGPSIAMAIKQATDEGALVALLVDRARPGEPALQAPFLGSLAPFPTAPWLIASALKVPVVLAFGLYRGGNRYDLVFERFSDSVAVPRQQRAQALLSLIGRYASRLEHHARNAPYNWFNFYDFWGNEDEGSLPSALDAPRIVAIDHADADAAVQRRTAVRRSA